MTLREVYGLSLEKLNEVDNKNFEAREIIKKTLSISDSEYLMKLGDEITDSQADDIISLVEKRAEGMPLQYILGEWDFYGLTFKVGKGVLIPRPETEELCEHVISLMNKRSDLTVADLCAGSGCIGLTIKNQIPSAKVYLVEKSLDAGRYLIENARTHGNSDDVFVVFGDVLEFEEFSNFPEFDFIISNPPYIKSDEIELLQSEVRLEPDLALDGGSDGYFFYRCLCDQWTDLLKVGGIIAFECGEGQADTIIKLLNKKGLEAWAYKDFNQVDRFIFGRKV